MRLKKYRIILSSFIVVFIIAAIFVINYINSDDKIDNIERNVAASEFKYYLKEYDEKIGVYRSNETEPFRILNVPISTLPTVDQMELSNGVMVLDDEKLKQLIEDYES